MLFSRADPTLSEDDEDEDEDGEGNEESKDPPALVKKDPDGGADAADVVKPDPDHEPAGPGEPRGRTPSHELHTFSTDELSRFKVRELKADVELLGGTYHFGSFMAFV